MSDRSRTGGQPAAPAVRDPCFYVATSTRVKAIAASLRRDHREADPRALNITPETPLPPELPPSPSGIPASFRAPVERSRRATHRFVRGLVASRGRAHP